MKVYKTFLQGLKLYTQMNHMKENLQEKGLD